MQNFNDTEEFNKAFDAIKDGDLMAFKSLLNMNYNLFLNRALTYDNSMAFAVLLEYRKDELKDDLFKGRFELLLNTIGYGALDCERMCRDFIKKIRNNQ